MIRINLLPVKRRKKAKPIPGFVVVTVISFVLVLIASSGVWFFLNNDINNLENQKKANAETMARLEVQIKVVKNFEKLNKLFGDRKEIIEKLRKNQSLPVRVLDEMSARLMQGVWLKSMSIRGSAVSISGVGFSNPEVVRYVQSLKESKLFTDVYLHETRRAKVKTVDVFNFRISLNIKGA